METSFMEVIVYTVHSHKYADTQRKLYFVQIHVNPKLNLTRQFPICQIRPHYPTACTSSRTKCGLTTFMDLPPRATRRLLDYRHEPSAAELCDG